MEMKRTSGRIVIPATPEAPETPPKPEKPYRPLELHDLEGRKEVEKAFGKILNATGFTCQGVVDELTILAREDLVYAVARQLLGADWDCERMC